jgi:hypothetical protein
MRKDNCERERQSSKANAGMQTATCKNDSWPESKDKTMRWLGGSDRESLYYFLGRGVGISSDFRTCKKWPVKLRRSGCE